MPYFHGMLRPIAIHILVLTICFAWSHRLTAQTAQVQFIHNSSDTELSLVSIWVNNTPWVNNIAYHEATPLTTLPISDSIEWQVRSAVDSNVTYFTWFASLEQNSKNIFTLHGHVQTTYQPSRSLSVEHFSEALSQSASTGSVDILFFHGATEFDTIDIAETELFELTAFDQLPYGRYSGYIGLFPADFGWSILNEGGNGSLGEYALPIATLNWAGQAITIVTAGYFNQANNNDGQPLGMWATTAAGGPMVCLQPMQWNLSAQVQFIHNATLPASQDVRIELDSTIWESSIPEHSSSPFHAFPAGQDVLLSIHSNLLVSPIDSLWSDTLHLTSGNRYQLIWYGGFSPESPAQLHVREYDDSTAMNDATMRLRLFNGASQWETIRLLADTLAQSPLIESVAYGIISDTLTLPITNEEWLLFSGNDSITALQAPLDTLNYNQQTVTALTCDAMNDSGIALWLSRENGGPLHRLSTLIIPEPPIYCDVQWVHASSDTLLRTVDLWFNDSLLFPSISFETASSFVNVQCNDGVIARITEAGNPSTVYFTDTLQLTPNQQHRIILWGIYDSPNYNPAPELDWYIDENFNASSTVAGQTDIRFFHTAGDIGILQVNEASIPIVPFFNQVDIGEMSYTQSLPANQNYGIEVLNAPTQFPYETYALPALEQTWENQSVTLISTGFRQPANNSDGEPLQVWALLPNGSMHALQQFVLTENIARNSHVVVFPNPANEIMLLKAASFDQGLVIVRVFDLYGNIVIEKKCVAHRGNINERVETGLLPSGMYTVQVMGETSIRSAPLVIQH